MNSGIYVLRFPNNIFYIGKSDNIPRRWEEHRKSFLKGSHTKKMQWAFDTYGMPEFEVLLECHRDHIDLMESLAIHMNSNHELLNGNKPSAVSQEEADILLNSNDELQLSTAEHIRRLKDLLIIKDKYEELKSTGIYLPEEVEEMPVQIEQLELENKWLSEDLAAANHRVEKFKNRGLLQRIFNYD